MQHIDEHTLELYVLGAPEAEPRRAEIDAHLPLCQGCRVLVEEMRRFHADLAHEMERPEAARPEGSALALRHQGVRLRGEEYHPPVRYQPRTPMAKARYFIMRYPVAAAAAGVTFAAMLIGLGMLLPLAMKSPPGQSLEVITDWNPAFCKDDLDGMYLEVFNTEQQRLWRAKLEGNASDVKSRADHGASSACVADLNGDGVNEVITVSRFAEDDRRDAQHLRAYDGHRTLVKDTTFTEDVPYLQRTYSPYIGLSEVRVMESDQPGRQEILVSGNSLARSPRLLLRIGRNFTVIGRYWHFGDLGPFLLRDLDGDGKPELIALGENDVRDDGTLGQFPVLVVLDPRKIVGTTRSTTAPGFRFAPSDAERYYVRFPATDFDSARGSGSRACAIEIVDADRFSLAVGDVDVYFHYFFSFDMHATKVKSNDVLDRAYAQLVREGKLRRSLTPEKLRELKEGVRYWNGTQWRAEVARVQVPHTSP